jgi:hypothetical protein
VENYNDKNGLWCQKGGTSGPCSNMLKKFLKIIVGIKNVCLSNDVTSQHAGMSSLSSNRPILASGIPRNFVWEGFQQIQLRTQGRENGDLGAAAL